ncbi:MAG: LysE family translocator [Streptosporangiales bacterium]|nr:LysE family translocator [Streptosporangiales bacterium]
MTDQLAAFLAVAVLLALTPGADTAVVLSRALRFDRPTALRTAFGVVSGLVLWAMAAAFGVSALLTASEAAYAVLRVAGAAYLVWLGIGQLWVCVRGRGGDLGTHGGEAGRTAAFRAGFVTNVLNPKVGVFYMSFLPQFIPPHADVMAASLVLAGIHVALSLAWLSVVAAGGSWMGRRLGPRFQQVMSGISGLVLLGFGARLAVSVPPRPE